MPSLSSNPVVCNPGRVVVGSALVSFFSLFFPDRESVRQLSFLAPARDHSIYRKRRPVHGCTYIGLGYVDTLLYLL